MKKEFRIWNKDGKFWYTKDITLTLNGDTMVYNKGNEYVVEDVPFWGENYSAVVVEQFTGKYDIHATKIFEGDIIEYTEKLFEHGDAQTLKGVVVYDEDYAAFGIASPNHLNSIWNLFSDMTVSNFKVIGNIHDEIKKTNQKTQQSSP